MEILKAVLLLAILVSFGTQADGALEKGPSTWDKQTSRSRGEGSYEWFAKRRTLTKVDEISTKKPKAGKGGFVNFIKRYFGLSKIMGKIKDSFYLELNCDSCRLGVSVVSYLKNNNKTDDEIIQTISDICVTFGVQSPRVCRGIFPAFRDEFHYILQNVDLDAQEICAFVVGPHCSEVPSKLHTWSVHIPNKNSQKIIRKPLYNKDKSGKRELKVLHLSDTHYDPFYVEGSNADCGEPLCCRDSQEMEIPYENRAGRWGDYRSCDTPKRTLDHMLDHIRNNHEIDYILWTGDLPPHDVWNQTRSTQIFHLYKMVQIMLEYFPDTPIFPAVGNHESSPTDSFPPPYIKGDISIDWLYSQLNHTWTIWLGPQVSSTVQKGAYYSVLAYPGFRIISINSNYCTSLNWWLLVNSTDPGQELQWLVIELQKSEALSEKVHIIGHIPPGSPNCHSMWSKNYNEIITRYQDIITGQFFGHNHVDEFSIFYEKLPKGKRKAINVAYIGPSTTPYKYLNPGYRIYTVDGPASNNTWKITDHETYYMNLTAANKYNSPIWLKEYSAKEDFGMKSLEPEEWDNLVMRLKTDEKLFDKYFRYYSRMSDDYPACNSHCKWNLICDLQKSVSHDLTFC